MTRLPMDERRGATGSRLYVPGRWSDKSFILFSHSLMDFVAVIQKKGAQKNLHFQTSTLIGVPAQIRNTKPRGKGKLGHQFIMYTAMFMD